MDSTTKDRMKIKSYLSEHRLKTPQEMKEIKYSWHEITNYDEMLKGLIISIGKTCDDVLLNLKSESYILAAYNIGMLQKEASNAIDQFRIGHLFKKEKE